MTYAELMIDIMRLIDGDEASPTDIPKNTLTQIISLGEQRIYKDVRSRFNEKDFADAIVGAVVTPVVVTGNLAPIPDDFEATSTAHFGKLLLRPTSEATVIEFNQFNPTGDVVWFAEAGANFTFSPPAEEAAQLQGRYFFHWPALDQDNAAANDLFQAAGDLFTFAALCEGAPVFGKSDQVPLWEAKYRAAADRVNRSSAKAAYSAGLMSMRPSTRLMR
jgi:hypothetical protein